MPFIAAYCRNHDQDKREGRMAGFSRAASATVLVGIAFGCAGAQAQGLIASQKLSVVLANELVGNAVAECAKKNYAVTATVVDLDGVRQAVLRGDGAPIHTLDNAAFGRNWDHHS
jgi:Haem-degrading